MNNSDNAIIIEEPAKLYKHFRVLDGVCFASRKGEILALLGPN